MLEGFELFIFLHKYKPEHNQASAQAIIEAQESQLQKIFRCHLFIGQSNKISLLLLSKQNACEALHEVVHINMVYFQAV